MQRDFGSNIVKAGFRQIRRDLQKDRAPDTGLCCNRIAGFQYLAEQFLEAVTGLQIPQARRVGR